MDRNADAIRRRVMPFTPISLEIEDADGSSFKQEWKLAINYNVLADAEEKTGYNFLGHLFDWIDSPKRLRALFWAALLPYQPELRDCFEEVGAYLDAGNRVVSIDALLKAYVRYLPKDKRESVSEACEGIMDFLRTGKAPEAEQPAASPLANGQNPSTGQNSAPSPATTSELLTTTNSAA